MDLNYLYHRHQVSLFRAEHSPCEDARAAHRDFARGYAERIASLRRQPTPAAE